MIILEQSPVQPLDAVNDNASISQPAPNDHQKEDVLQTQDKSDQRWSDQTQSIERELGMTVHEAKALIAEHNKRVEEEKTDLQKALDRAESLETALKTLELKNSIYTALLNAGASPKKIDKLTLRVIGKTPKEIQADVSDLKKEFPAMFGVYSEGSHPSVQDTPTPRVYRASEIRAMSHNERLALAPDIQRAMSTQGGIVMD